MAKAIFFILFVTLQKYALTDRFDDIWDDAPPIDKVDSVTDTYADELRSDEDMVKSDEDMVKKLQKYRATKEKKTEYEDIINKEQKYEEPIKEEQDNQQFNPTDISGIDVNKYMDFMIKKTETIDAEWLKRDIRRQVFFTDDGSDKYGVLQEWNARQFKDLLIRGLKEIDAKTWVKDIKKETDRFRSDEELKEGNLEGQYNPMTNDSVQINIRINRDQEEYGFEPNKRIPRDVLELKFNKMQYYVTQYAASEYPNTGKYIDHFEKGKYNCIGCDKKVFQSDQKYKSSFGYATFSSHDGDVKEIIVADDMTVCRCKNCGCYLGDIIEYDDQSSSGKAYLINSVSIDFQKYKFLR